MLKQNFIATFLLKLSQHFIIIIDPNYSITFIQDIKTYNVGMVAATGESPS